MERLISAVRADPALRDELERAILSEKLLHLPDQVADLVDIVTSFAEAADTQFAAVNSRLGTIEGDVGTLKSDVSVLKEDTATLKSDVATLKEDTATLKSDVAGLKKDVKVLTDDSGKTRGKLLEDQVRDNPGRFLGRHARRLTAVSVDDVLGSVDATLDDEAYDVLSRADAFLQGSERGTGDQIVIVVEATWRISMGDVTRTAAWARQLAAVGVRARGAIVSVEPPRSDVLAAAESESVWVVVDSSAHEAA